jgi:hypothetical protein
VCVLGTLSDTTKCAFTEPVSPSRTLVSPTDTTGGLSSSRIVTVPVPVAMFACSGSDSATVNCSSPSMRSSPTIETGIDAVVVPGRNVMVPEVAV